MFTTSGTLNLIQLVDPEVVILQKEEQNINKYYFVIKTTDDKGMTTSHN
jgi:hypothetical protein